MNKTLLDAFLVIITRCNQAEKDPLLSDIPDEQEKYLLGLVSETYESLGEEGQQEIKRFIHWLVTS